MAGDPHGRLEQIMSRLAKSSPSSSQKQKKPLLSSGIGGTRAEAWVRVRDSSIGSRGLAPQCRPWDRRDLMRRLATFKAMTWFAKPKAVSAINCARRGWVNVEMDVITCEACGARLLFSTPSSWSLEQVEKAAAVFSLKLDNGHRLLCPWIDNACDEKLALFPRTPPPALFEGYRDRSGSLQQLTALPVISSLAIDYMKCPQLEHFLSQSSCPPVTLENGIRLTDNPRKKDIGDASEDTAATLYYQAVKIISLCGWEPSLLPYVVDGKDHPSESSGGVHGEKKHSHIIHTSDHAEVDGNNNRPSHSGNQYDPASVVLDCKFCGARVGLWAFSMVQRPLEYFILSADSHGQKETATDPVSSLEVSKAVKFSKEHQNISSTSKEIPLGLNLTIAGGPPPTKQHFRPVVSFPIISRHLRADFSSTSGIKPSSNNEEHWQSHSQNDNPSQLQKDSNSDLVISSGDGRSLKRKRAENESHVSENNVVNDPSLSSKEALGNGLGIEAECMGASSESRSCNIQEIHSLNGGKHDIVNHEKIMHHRAVNPYTSNSDFDEAEGNALQSKSVCTNENADAVIGDSKACENNNISDVDLGDICNSPEGTSKVDSLNKDLTSEHNNGGALYSASHSAANATVTTSDSIVTERVDRSSDFKHTPNEKANVQETNSLGNGSIPSLHCKLGDFDPIRQHRTFCPWIASEDDKSLPGWRLTLDALIQHEKASSSDLQQGEALSTSTEDGDDPIASIRKLFMSPPTKRLK